MWATDATQIPAVLDGKVWLFGVIEHWNAGPNIRDGKKGDSKKPLFVRMIRLVNLSNRSP